MPRAFSSLTDAHRQRADVAWLRLATLTLWRDRYGPGAASLTLYASDATRYLPVAAGGVREYLPLVRSWGPVGDSLEALDPTTAPASLDLLCSDQVPIAAGGLTAPRLTAFLREGANVLGFDTGGGEVRIAWLPPGGVLDVDDVTLYIGRIDTFDPVDEATVDVRSTSTEGGAMVPVLDAAVGSGKQASLVTDLDWVNGFEEGDLPTSLTVDATSVWSYIQRFGAGVGLDLVGGIHRASQSAVRFTCDLVSAQGGTVAKLIGGTPLDFTAPGPAVLYGRLYVSPVATPTGGDSYQLCSLYTTSIGGLHDPGFRLLWLASGQYRLVNVGSGASADSSGPMGALDRLEWKVTPAGVECRIFTADSDAVRETLSAPGALGVVALGAQFQGICNAGHTGSHVLDDVGLSKLGWLGPGCVVLARPTSDLVTGWAPGASDYAQVDDHPGALNDADYIAASAAALDRYAWTLQGAPEVGARFYRVTVMVRGQTVGGTASIRTVLWTEKDARLNGPAWAPPASPGNPPASQCTMVNAWGRDQSALNAWSVGVEYLSGGVPVRVVVLYANVEYR